MKVLHVSHHHGCRHDLDYVADRLGFSLDHYEYRGGYNISAARAEAAWRTDSDRFLQYDVIVTSDTAPLSRIFLQNDWPKGLVVWVCNRFDYCDQATNDCGFPDPDYYMLFASAITRRRTVVAAYTPFEHHYARKAHGIPFATLTVKPHGARLPHEFTPQVPADVDKAASCFIPTYHNDLSSDLAERCRALGIPAFNGRYSGPSDLRGFNAIVHVPYAWSNFALFENLQAGMPYLIPSRRLLMELMDSTHFFWSPPFWPADIELSEWYTPDHRDVLTCFDSWDELRALADSDLAPRRDAIAAFCDRHERRTLAQWRDIFDRVG